MLFNPGQVARNGDQKGQEERQVGAFDVIFDPFFFENVPASAKTSLSEPATVLALDLSARP